MPSRNAFGWLKIGRVRINFKKRDSFEREYGEPFECELHNGLLRISALNLCVEAYLNKKIGEWKREFPEESDYGRGIPTLRDSCDEVVAHRMLRIRSAVHAE